MTIGGGASCQPEPRTAMTKKTKQTAVTAATNMTFATSQIKHSRHKSQGPMRSEKVYIMTKIINEKVEQLGFEQDFVKEKYIALDEEADVVKKDIQSFTQSMVLSKAEDAQLLVDKEEELRSLDQKEKDIRAKYEKMMLDMKDHIKAVVLSQDKAQAELKCVKAELKVERKKYDAFLARDADKLMWAQDLIRCRRLVQVSYENELARVHANLEKQNAFEKSMKKMQLLNNIDGESRK